MTRIISYADKIKNRMNRNAKNIDDIEDEMIDASIRCERYGQDDLIYFFKDGSSMIKRCLTEEFQTNNIRFIK